jgi:PKD repeat protein
MKNNLYLKRISKVFFALLLTFTSLGVNAQTYIVGDNNGTNTEFDYPCPIQDYYYGTHAQFLYTAAELAAAGINPGANLDSIGWIVEATTFTNPHLQEHYSIYLLNTTVSSLDLNAWETGATLVYGPMDYAYPSDYAGNVMFGTNYFTYTGGNLIVEVCGGDAGGGYTLNPMCQLTTGLPFNASHQWRQDATNGCGNVDPTNYALETSRPVLITHVCPPGVITSAFNTSNNNPPINTAVSFTDQSSTNAIGWDWDFGDGNTSAEQSPSHTYNTAGTYYISLTTIGCTASDISYDTITVQSEPVAVVTPDSLSATLACGDSITFQIDISNTGTGDLVYGTGGSTNSQVRMLALTYGVDINSEYAGTLSAINTYFTNYVLTDSNATDPSIVSNLLVGNNVLLLAEPEFGNAATYHSWAYAINTFLLTGGTVIECGTTNVLDTNIFTIGLWGSTGYPVTDIGTGGHILTVDSITPLTTGLPASFAASTSCYPNLFSNSDKRTVVSYNGADAVCYRKVGGGKAIFIANDFYGPDDNAKRIIANAVQWGGESGLPSWITTSTNAGTVTPGDNQTMDVTFHASGLPSGTYYGILGISTNDPNNPYVAVSCTLTVTGGPIVSLSDSCVDFGTIMENTTQQRTFNLINSGCDTMFVTGITAGLPEYNITGTPNILLPGASAQINVSFHPTAVGTFNSSITIQNSAGDTTFCLNGSAGPAPVISTVNSVTNQINSCTGTTTSTFDINNNGGSDLNYTITGFPSWAQLSSYSGSVVAASLETITVTFDATGLNDGTYNANLLVTSNDPITPTVTVALHLTVDGDPVVAMSVPCLNFSPIFEGAQSSLTFTISNTGCDTLDVTGLVPSLPEYTTSASPGSILPGGSSTITVTFYPLIAGSYNGTLEIQNTDVDTTICLTGDGLIAPHLDPNTTFTVAHDVEACNGVDSTSFTFYNNGGSDLNWTIAGVPSWATFSSTAGTVAAGDSIVITVVMNSGNFSAGTQTANFTINSNDPVTPNLSVTLSMQVGTNPCFTAQGSINTCTGIGNFTSTVSVNPPTTWLWDFGDGGTSTSANPQHQFGEPTGTAITVLAIGCVGVVCDTQVVQLVMPLVTGPVAAACLPQTTDPGTAGSLGIGITMFQLESINKTSQNSAAGYQNFTCTDTTTLTCGMSYQWTAATGQTYEETVKGYLDFNNDGTFDQVTELIFQDSAVTLAHVGTTITMPANPPVLGTALRLRVQSEYSGNPVPNGCSDMLYGQTEDYAVFMQCAVGMNNLGAATSFTVYPNPFDKSSTIEYNLNTASTVTVEVFNAVGERVESYAATQMQSAGKHAYQFTGTTAGIYTVKLTVGDKSTVQKLVKMQ